MYILYRYYTDNNYPYYKRGLYVLCLLGLTFCDEIRFTGILYNVHPAKTEKHQFKFPLCFYYPVTLSIIINGYHNTIIRKMF